MTQRLLPVVLSAVVVAALGSAAAQAEIYTWVDKSGVTNVSNLPPPEGAKVTKVQHAPPPEIVAREDAARDAARQAENQALEARVRELEDQAHQMPPPDFRPILPPPPVIQYIVQAPQPPMQQTVEVTPPGYGGYGGYGYGYGGYGCDPSWFGCSWPAFYPVFVVTTPNSHNNNTRPVHHGDNMTGPRLPPPFGPPLMPNFGPSSAQKIVVQPPFASPMGVRRG